MEPHSESAVCSGLLQMWLSYLAPGGGHELLLVWTVRDNPTSTCTSLTLHNPRATQALPGPRVPRVTVLQERKGSCGETAAWLIPNPNMKTRLPPLGSPAPAPPQRPGSSSMPLGGETQKPQRLCVQRCFLVFSDSLFPFKGRDGIGKAPSMSPLMPRSRPPSTAPTSSFRTWITLTY